MSDGNLAPIADGAESHAVDRRTLLVGAAGALAAAVMIGVFAVFVTLTFLDFKEMGFGLAVAVLLDATIIRGILLPASMKLLGDWNWYLPQWLEWLPRLEPEAGVGDEPVRARVGAPPVPTA